MSSIEKIEAQGEIAKITLGKDKNVNSVFVQGKPGVRGGYDQANVLIDDQTKIYQGYTDQQLTAGDLEKEAEVNVAFTDSPRFMIYPVSGSGKNNKGYGTAANKGKCLSKYPI